jgi:hypothetical protein
MTRRLKRGRIRMRRLILLPVALAVAFAALPVASSSARTLTERNDRDEPHLTPDIRKVWTDGSPGVFVRIATWDRVQPQERNFLVALDTRGSRHYDRVIEIHNHDGNVWRLDEGGSFQELLGQRRVHQVNPRTLVFHGPTDWFGIARRVRFIVESLDRRSRREDRAPTDGRYIRL